MSVSLYNEQALASTALIRTTFQAQVSYVKKELPPQDIVVEIGVERKSDIGRVHEVATVHMDYTSQTTLKLKICVHKEEQVNVRQLTATDSKSSMNSPLMLTNGEMQLTAPMHFHLMNKQTMAHFKENKVVDGYGRCPNAMKVLEIFHTLFPQGVPVPGAQSGEQLHFHYRIIVHAPGPQQLETLYMDTKTGSSGISNIDSSNKGASNYTYPELLEMHTHMVRVAAGLALPSSMEQKGTITQQRSSFAITDGKSNEKKRLPNNN